MRSEIADLIRGSIYQNLNDAPNVHRYESITGMTKDLFFLTHDKFEKSVQCPPMQPKSVSFNRNEFFEL